MRLIQAEALLAAANGAALPSDAVMQLFQHYVDGLIYWSEVLFHWQSLQDREAPPAPLPCPDLRRNVWAEC